MSCRAVLCCSVLCCVCVCVRGVSVWSVECRAECGVRSAEGEVGTVDCSVWSVEEKGLVLNQPFRVYVGKGRDGCAPPPDRHS